jgi:hypothetical protein
MEWAFRLAVMDRRTDALHGELKFSLRTLVSVCHFDLSFKASPLAGEGLNVCA